MNTKTITVNEQEIVIQKLPLRRYAELFSSLQEFPKLFSQLNGKPTDEIITQLPQIITTCYPDVRRAIMVMTPLTAEEIDEMGIDDLVTVIEEVVAINNLGQLYDRIKKLGAGQQKLQGAQTTEIAPTV